MPARMAGIEIEQKASCQSAGAANALPLTSGREYCHGSVSSLSRSSACVARPSLVQLRCEGVGAGLRPEKFVESLFHLVQIVG